MNEPGYRREHGIDAIPGSYVNSSATFTREEYAHMQTLRRLFYLLEKFGVLRHAARYVRQETVSVRSGSTSGSGTTRAPSASAGR